MWDEEEETTSSTALKEARVVAPAAQLDTVSNDAKNNVSAARDEPRLARIPRVLGLCFG